MGNRWQKIRVLWQKSHAAMMALNAVLLVASLAMLGLALAGRAAESDQSVLGGTGVALAVLGIVCIASGMAAMFCSVLLEVTMREAEEHCIRLKIQEEREVIEDYLRAQQSAARIEKERESG